MAPKTNIAFVGTGFVADFYAHTLKNHPNLNLKGVFDIDQQRQGAFCKYYRATAYRSFDELLQDDKLDIVVNLTNPGFHFDVTKACLEHGKNVYTEKPLGWTLEEGRSLLKLSQDLGLRLAAAPCNVLGEAAQSVWKSLRENKLGDIRLVYAEMDDGLLHRQRFRKWKSPSGAYWPYKDEFQVGCTLEHAGYLVTWLLTMFGPAKTVTSFSKALIPMEDMGVELDSKAPDFSLGCLEFESGVVARISCSIIAEANHSMTIFGDDAVMEIKNTWDYGSPIYYKKRNSRFIPKRRMPLVRKFSGVCDRGGHHRMDFARGIAELAAAIHEERNCRLSAEICLHSDEICHAMQDAELNGKTYQIQSSFTAPLPMDWAR